MEYNETLNKLNNFSSIVNEISSIKTAISCGLFELLEENFLTIDEIINFIGFRCPKRNVIDLLDILYTTNHLQREGNSNNAKYRTANKLFLKSNNDNLNSLVLNNFDVIQNTLNIDKYMFEYHDKSRELKTDPLVYLSLKTKLDKSTFEKLDRLDFSKYIS